MFHKRVLHCKIYSTSSFTRILLTQKYQCNHLEKKWNYIVYKIQDRYSKNSARVINGRPAVFSVTNIMAKVCKSK